MTTPQHQMRTRRGTGLSGREVRRIVDIVHSAESERRRIPALSELIPGLVREDARVIRDELVRRRMTAGDPSAAIVIMEDGEPVLAGADAVTDGDARVPAGGCGLEVQLVAGVRFSQAALRALLHDARHPEPEPESLRLGLVVRHMSFHAEESGPDDLVAINGGVCGVALAGSGERYEIRSHGLSLATGVVPAEADVWQQSCAALAQALERSALLRTVSGAQRRGDGGLPDLVFPRPLTGALQLAPETGIEVETTGGRCSVVAVSSERTQIPMGDPE